MNKNSTCECVSDYSEDEDVINAKYCYKCGSALVERTEISDDYCKACGKRSVTIYKECPKKNNWINQLFDIDHTSVEIGVYPEN